MGKNRPIFVFRYYHSFWCATNLLNRFIRSRCKSASRRDHTKHPDKHTECYSTVYLECIVQLEHNHIDRNEEVHPQWHHYDFVKTHTVHFSGFIVPFSCLFHRLELLGLTFSIFQCVQLSKAPEVFWADRQSFELFHFS